MKLILLKIVLFLLCIPYYIIQVLSTPFMILSIMIGEPIEWIEMKIFEIKRAK